LHLKESIHLEEELVPVPVLVPVRELERRRSSCLERHNYHRLLHN
jgi:hypothetical protein